MKKYEIWWGNNNFCHILGRSIVEAISKWQDKYELNSDEITSIKLVE